MDTPPVCNEYIAEGTERFTNCCDNGKCRYNDSLDDNAVLGETLKDTMKGIGDIRISVHPLNGVTLFWAECNFRHLSKESPNYQFSVDAGKYVVKPSRTPIDTKVNLKSDSLPRLISMIESAAQQFKETASAIDWANFGGGK
jgi:hypothetical protein